MNMIFRFIGGWKDGTTISCNGSFTGKYVFLTAGGTVGRRFREIYPGSEELLSEAVWRLLQDEDAVELGLKEYAGQDKSDLDLAAIGWQIMARGFDNLLTERLVAEMWSAGTTLLRHSTSHVYEVTDRTQDGEDVLITLTFVGEG